ncbi:hypothetical protein HUJ04_006201 [Dendroctonus ponderosae]|nr:hypothetical protein HUJ04_006201 [Dendroctonus ponderosae]
MKRTSMLGGVAGRHMSRRRGSSPAIKWEDGAVPVSRYARRRRAAVTTSDHKSCALIQTRLKIGDIIETSTTPKRIDTRGGAPTPSDSPTR